jgi:hypothetical protein
MKANREFLIEYVQPGMVRSGRDDRTDFGLVYREDDLKFYFSGEGIWSGDDRLVGYEVKIPKELKGYISNSELHNKMIRIIGRVKDYIESDELRGHRNVSMEYFCDTRMSFITGSISEADRQRIGFGKLSDHTGRPLDTNTWTVDRYSGSYLIGSVVRDEDNRNDEAFWFCWQGVLMRVQGQGPECRTDGSTICNWHLLSIYPPLPANLRSRRDEMDAALQLALTSHIMRSPARCKGIRFSGFAEEPRARPVKHSASSFRSPSKARSSLQSPRAFAFGLRVRAFLQKHGWIK